MKGEIKDLLILGAGLTGLALAYFLKEKGLRITILEASNRIGGRILTIRNNHTPIEMGATWISPQHTEILGLLKELKLDIFEQKLGETAIYEPMPNSPHQQVSLPANQEPSYRIKEGSDVLIKSLQNQIESKNILMDCAVHQIEQGDGFLLAGTNRGKFKAHHIVSTLPPFLFHNTIKVTPSLPDTLCDVAKKTHTWMGESIKIGLSYSQDFWNGNNLSSTIFSNQGPITEMYDHSTFDHDKFALKGFLHNNFASITKEERLEIILRQLEKYYGSRARDYLGYHELIWQDQPHTYLPYQQHIFPHQNNGHIIYRDAFLNNKLFIAGTETASAFPGYMEGAVRSAKEIASKFK